MKKTKKLILCGIMMNVLFILLCITVFVSTKNMGSFSIPHNEKVINSTSDPNQLRKIVLHTEDSYEIASTALDTHLEVLKLVLAYAVLVACFNAWCLFLVYRRRGESSANHEDTPA